MYDRHGNLVKAIRGEAMNTGENDGERTGELYAYNLAGGAYGEQKAHGGKGRQGPLPAATVSV